jgi:hypothetical protein
MPLWTVGLTDGEDERVEAEMLATQGGALLALSGDGLMMRAWAPGQWCTVRHLTGVEAHPAGRGHGNATPGHDAVLVRLPNG